jgi:hypothetical protein
MKYLIRDKFYHTQLAKLLEIDVYDPMRSNTSLLVVFYLIQLLRPKNILEIGFYEGQTMAAMIEASRSGTNLTALDIRFKRDIYDQYYHDGPYTDNKNINLVQIRSCDFTPAEKYDFINVDASWDRSDDIQRAVNWLTDDGVIMLDNYNQIDNLDQIVESMKENNIQPFLLDDQALYFHNMEHDLSELMDIHINGIFSPHYDTSNIEYYGNTVKQVKLTLKNLHNWNRVHLAYCRTMGL